MTDRHQPSPDQRNTASLQFELVWEVCHEHLDLIRHGKDNELLEQLTSVVGRDARRAVDELGGVHWLATLNPDRRDDKREEFLAAHSTLSGRDAASGSEWDTDSNPDKSKTSGIPDTNRVLSSVDSNSDAADTHRDVSPTLKWCRFPHKVFPEPLQKYIRVVSKAIGCDPSFVALPLLAVLAAAIGNSRRIQLKRGWTEPAIVWTTIIGESGSQKSPPLRQVLKPLQALQRQALEAFQREYEEFQLELANYKRALAEYQKSQDGEPPPEEPERPKLRRFVVSDATVEALAVILQDNPRGVLMARDELSGWIGGFDRYGSGKGADAAHWLTLFNGDNLLIDRKTGVPPTICVPAASVSVTGSIQPAVLWHALGRENLENGLGARFLLAWPPPKKKRWSEAEIPDDVEKSLSTLLTELIRLEGFPNPDTGEIEPGVLTFDAQAKSVWEEFYNQHADEMANLTGDLAAVYSKLEGYAARIALIFHLVRVAAGDAEARPMIVDYSSLGPAITLVRWFANESQRMYRQRAETDEERRHRELLGFIRKKGGTVTVRDVVKGSRLFDNSADTERELMALAAAGVLARSVKEPGPSGGRPTNEFTIVDETS